MSDLLKNSVTTRTSQPNADELARHLAAARRGDQAEFSALIEPYHHELIAHCYRMLGSLQDAEDMVQETFLRAWRRLETYEGRASFRAWLYKIATNACLDVLEQRSRRILPTDLGPASNPDDPARKPELEPIWLEPFPDEFLAGIDMRPEAKYDLKESITLAFLAALQTLPPRQRSILLLCDVLGWHSSEASELLETSVTAINSTLQRARSSMAAHYSSSAYEHLRANQVDGRTKSLLDQYLRAWETADIDTFVSLLKEDAAFPMPPQPMWYQGRQSIRSFVLSRIFSAHTPGLWRFQPVQVNTQPGFAWYIRDAVSGKYQAYGIQVLTIEAGQIASVLTFIYPTLFPYFGLPLEMTA